MPAGKGMGSGARKMSAAPRKSKQTRTVRGPQGLPTQATSTQRPAPPPRERPKPAADQFAFNPRASTPLRRSQKASQRKVSRAQERAPQRSLPSVPELERPSRQQIRAAADLYRKSFQEQVASAPAGTARQRQMRSVERELQSDPRTRRQLDILNSLLSHDSTYQARNLGVKAKAGRPPTQVAGLSLGAVENLVGDIGDQIKTGQGVAAARFVTKDAPKFLGRAGSDAINLPRNAVLGTYEIGAAAVEAAQGDTERGRKLIDSLDEGALGNALRGNWDEAARQFGEHPLYSGLEVTGAGQIIGRITGAGLRAAALKAGSTKRAPLEIAPGTNLKVNRSYSPNAIVKAAQVFKDRRQGNVATPSQRKHAINQAVDEFAAQEESLRRGTRVEASKAARDALGRERGSGPVAKKLGRTKPEQQVAQLAVERVLTGPENLRRDVTREIDRLSRVYTAESSKMSAGARKANREQRAALAAVLENPKSMARAGEMFERAAKYTDESRKVEDKLIESGVVAPEQALAAKLRPYAVSVMGAKPNRVEGRKTPLGLIDDDGKPVTTKQILEHMSGVEQRTRQGAASEPPPASAQFVHVVRDTGVSAKAKLERIRTEGLKPTSGVNRVYAWGPGHVDRAEDFAKGGSAVQVVIDGRGLEAHGGKNAATRTFAGNIPPERLWLRAPDGTLTPLVSKTLTESVQVRDPVPMPGFASQRRDTSGAKSYFVNWLGQSRKTVDSKKRTGEASRLGAYATGTQALTESLVRSAGVAEAVQGFDRFVGKFGVKRPDGKAFTMDDAERVAGEMAERTGMDWVPVRAAPARYGQQRLQEIIDEQGSGSAPALDSFMDDLLTKAASPDQADNVVLVPAQAMERFREHQKLGSTAAGKLGDAVTSAFRTTVLPLSTKWITGNVAEALLRSAMVGTTPVDILRGAKVMKTLRKLDEDAYTQAHSRLRGGLLIGSAEKLNVRRTSEAFENTILEKPAVGAAVIRRTPVVKETIDGINVLTGAVFNLNKRFEQLAQTAAIGRQSRKHMAEFTDSWARSLMLQRKAYEEVAEGLLDTDTQVKFARALDETLGKYNRFSPTLRRATQTMAPFLPWFLNAGRFVTHTLPVKHPVKAATLTLVERSFEEEWKEQQKKIPPGDLRYAIRRKDGGLVNLARYTPFGLTTGGPETITEPLLPQISSIVHILGGRSFTGKPLRLENPETKDSEGKRLWLAMYSALESTVPGLQLGRRLSEKGETAYDDSTIFDIKTKRGTSYGSSAPDRVFNPVRPTYLSPPQSSSSESTAETQSDPVLDARLEALEGVSTGVDPDVLEARLKALGR